MTEELKPCPFCGGKAVIAHPKKADLFTYDKYYVQCTKCKATASTVSAWEMRTECAATDTLTTERTAKVVHKQTDVNGMPWGKCGECNNLVFGNYCSNCGAKMDWGDERR